MIVFETGRLISREIMPSPGLPDDAKISFCRRRRSVRASFRGKGDRSLAQVPQAISTIFGAGVIFSPRRTMSASWGISVVKLTPTFGAKRLISALTLRGRCQSCGVTKTMEVAPANAASRAARPAAGTAATKWDAVVSEEKTRATSTKSNSLLTDGKIPTDRLIGLTLLALIKITMVADQ